MWGLQLYLSAASDLHTAYTETHRARKERPQRAAEQESARNRKSSGGTPPASHTEDKYTGGNGGGEGGAWLAAVAGIALVYWVACAWRSARAAKR